MGNVNRDTAPFGTTIKHEARFFALET